MINSSVLVGRLTRDPELRYTSNGVPVAQFTLAVNRNFKNPNGEVDADFINCVIWQDKAERLSEWCHKGSLIGVTGRIQTRNYENDQGQRVYVTEVVCDNFHNLEYKSNGNKEKNDAQIDAMADAAADKTIDFKVDAKKVAESIQGSLSNPENNASMTTYGSVSPDIADADLPF